MLWVFKRTVSMRRFFWAPKTYVKTDGRENINNFTPKNFVHLPINTAPRVSKMDPNIQAFLRVSTLAPTDDPNELATSLAPIPKARTKAMINDTTTIHTQLSSTIVQLSPNKDDILE